VTEFVGDGCNGIAGKRYRVHTFSTVGQNTLTVTSPLSLEYLVIGGGGGGGGLGGGGGGGFREGVLFLTEANYNFLIGAGGIGLSNGQNSEAFGIIAFGGGGSASVGTAGLNGASGGGSQGTPGLGNTPPTLPIGGYDGGSGAQSGTRRFGGSGGGAGGPGINSLANQRGATGGPGRQSSINGLLTWYSGGGGGFGQAYGAGVDGLGGGILNFGGGANGHTSTGGQGVIIIRYLIETP
jgi:hypothetical protein